MVSSNGISTTPLDFLEPVFIVLFLLLVIYVIAIIINVSIRMKKFNHARSNNLAEDNLATFSNKQVLPQESTKNLVKQIFRKRVKKIAKFNDLELKSDSSKEVNSFHMQTFLTNVKNNLKNFTLNIGKVFNKIKSTSKLYIVKLINFIKHKANILFSITKTYLIKIFTIVKKFLNASINKTKTIFTRLFKSLKKKINRLNTKY